jgi:tripartite-type tricarboxylate transporter receptor subunit TctC
MADDIADFYQRTPLNLYVGSGAGGGFDAYARVFAAHFAQHLPGHPSIVIRNMPGASGLVAVNSLYNSAPRDGSAILASFNMVLLNGLYGDTKAKFDPLAMGWLGSIGKLTGTCLTRKEAGIRTIDDAKKREVLMGATGDVSTATMYPKLLNTTLGTKFKVIAGYSTPGLRLAVESGEVEGICGIAWETHLASVPHWILDNKVDFLIQLGLSESAHMRGVPVALDLVKDKDARSIFEMLGIPQEFGRPFVAPPGVPADRLAALRKAFDETMQDKAYLADAERAKQPVDPLSGEAIAALIRRAYAAPKDVIDRAAVYAASSD